MKWEVNNKFGDGPAHKKIFNHIRVFKLFIYLQLNFTGVSSKGGKTFSGQILQKKLDHSTRIFKKVSRMASAFPMAKESGTRDVIMWSSDDCLG